MKRTYRNHPIGQIASLGHLHCPKNGDVDMSPVNAFVTNLILWDWDKVPKYCMCPFTL